MAQPNTTEVADVVVVGAACLDIKGRIAGDVVAGTSNPGDVRISVGGCARNVAENLARLGMPTALLSVVCQDDFGHIIVQQTERAGVNTDHMLMSCEQHSAAYMALLGAGGALVVGIDDTAAVAALTPGYIHDHAELLAQARMVVIDANVPLPAAEALLAICGAAGVPVALDPVAYGLAVRYRELIGAFYLAVPNAVEAQALTGLPVSTPQQGALAAKQLIAQGVEIAIITLGLDGLVYATADSSGYVPALKVEAVDPTGAGDALTAAVVYALLNDIPVDDAVRLGVSAATLTIDSADTVRQDLSLESLYAQLVI
ncbi:MAG TPA: carbohydrate kinase family protein [Kouleothrix sp.]|uniref:carbohydrate kinase family protein n=1 Tax=Kouleothrix sp. TaxID=2779161 RepID=UPI002D07A121|nr:carbohydrate kinase family protein [Kouleothrix sp.]HRC75522.1 carbohydrate kinase family protein [Kouleothrix sp.]